MNIQKYLDRIQYKGELSPTIEVLKELQTLHLFNVPFENLDIHCGNEITLDIDNIYRKIVENNRGGFCYELNGLFFELLKDIGFKAKIVSARVYHSQKGEYGQEFDHLVIIVAINETEYLVDAGFGEFTFRPLQLDFTQPQKDLRRTYVIEAFESDGYKVSKLVGAEKITQYIFSKKARKFTEFQGMCQFHQTSPDSHFTKQKLITKPLVNGRITIAGKLLKITEGDKVTQEMELSEEGYREQLLKYFNLEENKIKSGGERS